VAPDRRLARSRLREALVEVYSCGMERQVSDGVEEMLTATVSPVPAPRPAMRLCFETRRK